MDMLLPIKDCVDHIQKGMGKGLRVSKMSKKVLDDGFGIEGQGRLTDLFMKNIPNYHGAAIRNNSENLQNIENTCYTGHLSSFDYWKHWPSNTTYVQLVTNHAVDTNGMLQTA